MRRGTPLLSALLLITTLLGAQQQQQALAGEVDRAADRPDDVCIMLHLRDRNMEYLKRSARRAAGLGPGAGEYMSLERVVELTGRSDAELGQLAGFVAAARGKMGMVGPLRDAAAACFAAEDAAALPYAAQAETESPASQAPSRRRLLQDTAQAAETGALGRSGSLHVDAALSLAALMPAELAALTHAIRAMPGDVAGSHSQIRAEGVISAGPKIDGEEAPVEDLPSDGPTNYTKRVSGSFTLNNTQSPYPGVPLGSALGAYAGLQDPATNVSWAIPYFVPQRPQHLMSFLGLRSVTDVLNNVNQQLLSLMVPCSFSFDDAGVTITNVSYTSWPNRKACVPSFSFTFNTNYPGDPTNVYPSQNIMVPPSAITTTTCGQAVRFSQGQGQSFLPDDTCAAISQQLAAATMTANDIGDSTMIYTIDWVKAGIPMYTGLPSICLLLVMPDSVPDHLRSAFTVQCKSYIAVAGKNRPSDLLKLYGADKLPNSNKAARNTLTAVAGFWPAVYYYSPFDLSIANEAFGKPIPAVQALLNLPFVTENNPIPCYDPANSLNWCGESSLDIQMITQYGANSGAAFGFAAANQTITPAVTLADFNLTSYNLTNYNLSSVNWSAYNLSNYDYYTAFYDTSALPEGLQPAFNNFLFVDQIEWDTIFRANMGLKPMPDVQSWSWGGGGIADDSMLAKLAAMGITVFASSGDNGSVQPTSDPDATCGGDQGVSPGYPAASEWVTAVGAVQQARTGPGEPPVWVANMGSIGGVITTSGGFGNVSLGTMPAWQADVVSAYIASQRNSSTWPLTPELVNTNCTINGACFSATCDGTGPDASCVYGRAFPDLSLAGFHVPIMTGGTPLAVSGTSVSTPVMAGLVNHINAAIRNVPGQEDMKIGYMNPFLYWAAKNYPNAFMDITIGSNNWEVGTGSAPVPPCPYGYNAAPGWDATTGLGIPNIKVLQTAALKYVKIQKQQMDRRRRQRAAARKQR